MPQYVDVPAVGLQEPETELENRALAGPGNTQHHLGFTASQLKGDAIEYRRPFKRERNIFKDDRLVDRIDGLAGKRLAVKRAAIKGRHGGQLKVMKSCVRTASTARMSTDATTTAWVVDRPTPCVPPLVFM